MYSKGLEPKAGRNVVFSVFSRTKALHYLSTRPDKAKATNILSRYKKALGVRCLQAGQKQ